MATVRHSKISGETNPVDGRVGGEDWDADHDVTLVDADIPAAIARDAEVAASVAAEAAARDAAIAAHAAAGDPHSVYLTPLEGDAAYEPIGALRTAILGVGNSETTYTSGSVVLSALANLTIRSTTGQAFQLSAAAQSVQTQGMVALSASDALFSSGTVVLTGIGGGVTVDTGVGSIRLSVAAPVAQTVQTQNLVDMSLSGNTAGVMALISSGTLTLAGGNNITLSQNGNAVTISGPAAAGAQTAISGLANSQTTYTSGTVSLAELGAITIRSTTGNQFQFSVAAQSVQAETQTFVAGIRNSETTYTSGTINLSVNGGALTIRSTTGNAFQFSVSQSVQAETQTFVGGLGNSQATYTSGTVNLSVEGGAMTIRSTTGQAFRFSVSQSIQAETQTFLGALANSETTYTSGSVTLSALGAITIRSTTGQQFQLSVNSQTVQTQNLVVLSDGANVISSGTVRLTNANGVSFSINGQTLSGSIDRSISMYAVSNTTQSSTGTAAASALSFGGAGIASVGVTGGSVVISVPAGGGGGDGGVFAGVSTAGNTAGSTGTVSTGNLVLVGSQGITLSQSTGAAGSAATITILGPDNFTYSGLNPYRDIEKVTGQVGQGTLNFDPMRIEAPVQFDRILMPIVNTNSSNSSGSHTLSFWGGLYTRNAATLSLLQSWSSSTALTHSGTAGSYSLYSGQRLFSIPFTTTLTKGDYWLGVVSRTTSGGANGSYSQFVLSNAATDFLGHFGSSHNTTMQLTLGQGVYSATTSGMPAAVSFSQIRGSDSMARRAPFVMFASSTV